MASTASRFGFRGGWTIVEWGFDDDVDMTLRSEIEEEIGSTIEDEDFDGGADSLLLWWRSDDGDVDDLGDTMTDAAFTVESDGAHHPSFWLMVPSFKEPGHVSAVDVNDALEQVNMRVTATQALESGWTAHQVQRLA